MSLHTFDAHRPVPTPAGTSALVPLVLADRMGVPGPRSFAVRLRFPTPAARTSGFEVVAAEAQVGDPGQSGRLSRVVELAGRELLILVDGATDPDAALGVATEALRESLLTFRVAAVAPADSAIHQPG